MNQKQHISEIQQSYGTTDTLDNLDKSHEKSMSSDPSTLDLIHKLCQILKAEKITYCHWKSNNALDRSASGDNDLDLLVSRADMLRFAGILCRLGFKPARASDEKQMPGVLDYFGYDEKADKLVHVHAHYQLILGHDMTKNYRLPIERQYLESAIQGDLFRVPASEFEFIIFVIRMVLKHSTWDLILSRQGRLKSAELQELAYLQARINQDRVDDILKRFLPYIGVELFKDCAQALQPDCSVLMRVKTGQQLQTRLQTNARRPLPNDVLLKLWRRVALAIRRRIFKSSFKYRLESGGAVIAIVGGDGAGKSTAVDALYSWLSHDFKTTRVHMGKPDWSWTTLFFRGILKIGNLLGLYPVETSYRETLHQKSLISPGYPWLIREVCRARDRYWTYVKARRFATSGGLVILDRFPLPQIRLMDGPRSEQFVDELMDAPQGDRFMSPRPNDRLFMALQKIEKSYYQEIVFPEMLFVLRLDPEIAVRRRSDEDPDFVRARNREIWELNWENTGAHVIDGSKSKKDVLPEIKAHIWSGL